MLRRGALRVSRNGFVTFSYVAENKSPHGMPANNGYVIVFCLEVFLTSARKEAPTPVRSESEHSATCVPFALNAQEDIRRELATILGSPEFRTSQRSQTLLRYLVDSALEAGPERLKERTIGAAVFHRDVSYDTGQDAIVRVAANDVRKRLAAYYQRQDPPNGLALHISLPPGSYIPDFVRPEKAASLHDATPKAGTSLRRWLPWALSIALAAVCVTLLIQNAKLRASGIQPSPHLSLLPWSQIAPPGATVTLVASDSNFSFYKSFLHADQSLQVYVSHRWLDDLATRLPFGSGLSNMPLTSIANASLAAQIGSVLRRGGASISVRSGRTVQVGDFKSDRSVILIGSSYANPWVSLVNEHLNFRIGYDPAIGKQVCRNASPLPGESAVYQGTARTPASGVGYATISLVPNLSHHGFVLLIAGTNMEGTEAAGELVTDLPRLAGVLRTRGIDPSAKVEQLELLLRLDHMDTQSGGSEVIAHRVIR